MNPAIKYLYNSLIDISTKEYEHLSYAFFPYKRKYTVIHPYIKNKAAKILTYFYEHYKNSYDALDEDDKLKVKTMINALIEIKDAEVISLPYGLFDTLERCYVADTVDVASRTIRKIKRYI